MSYSSEVLADSPWGYWKTDETSGTSLADSSGNTRAMTVQNGPTFAQTGPDGSTADAISWTNTINQYAVTSATSTAGLITMEAWVYLTANPSSLLGVMARSIGIYSSGASDGELTIDSSGRPGWMVFDGSANRFIVGSSALSLNTWHHMVGSVGAAGMKLRVDKVTVTPTGGTNPLVTSTTAYTGASQLIFMRAGGSRCASVSPIKIAREAYYATQLSDARTDAHYDAMSAGSPDATVAPPAATATASASVPVVSASSVVAPPVASATASAPVPTISNGSDANVLAPVAMATASAPVPVFTQIIPAGTNTTNFLNGRNRRARASVTVTRPVGTAPSNLAPRHDKAVPLPPPTLVDGRVT